MVLVSLTREFHLFPKPRSSPEFFVTLCPLQQRGMIPDHIARELSAFETQVNSMLAATVSYATLWAITATTTLLADEPCVVPAEEIESLPKLGVVEFFDRLRHPVLEAVPVRDLREERRPTYGTA